MAVRHRRKLEYEDYAAFPDDGLRRELIDGELYVSPAPTTWHQEVVQRLFFAVERHLRAHGGGRVFVSPIDVVLTASDTVQPDVVFVADDRLGLITERNIAGSPTLLVEVVSDPVRDRLVKRDLYEGARVLEYWVVDPFENLVEVWRLGEEGYEPARVLRAGDTLASDHLPGLTVDVGAIFVADRPTVERP